MSDDRPVSIGFLTPRDLRVLGEGFTRHFPIADDGMFDDLLEQLNKIAPTNRAQGDDTGTA